MKAWLPAVQAQWAKATWLRVSKHVELLALKGPH